MEYHTKQLTTGQAALAFRVSIKTIQQWVDRGLLECWKTPGGHRRISPDSMAALKARLAAWSLSHLRMLLACNHQQSAAEYMATLFGINPEHEIHNVGDGPGALFALARLRPDVLICDLPLGGVELDAMVAAIKQDRELSRTRIVLLCDNPDALLARFGKQVACIEKTANREWLQQQFQRAISNDFTPLASA